MIGIKPGTITDIKMKNVAYYQMVTRIILFIFILMIQNYLKIGKYQELFECL